MVEPKTSKPVFSTEDVTLLRECIQYYLNAHDYQMTANTTTNFTPTQKMSNKRDKLLNLIHRLGRI